MDKNTLSNYGWIVVLILILSVMLALATPFGNFIARGFEASYVGFDYTANEALGTVIGLDNGNTEYYVCPNCSGEYANVFNNGNGTHSLLCVDCGTVWKGIENETHYDNDNNNVCDFCGADLTGTICDHVQANFVDNGNGTHTLTCLACSEKFDDRTYSHTDDADGNGICDATGCGAVINSGNESTDTVSCSHTNIEYSYVDDNTHDINCSDCGETVRTGEAHSIFTYENYGDSHGTNCNCGASTGVFDHTDSDNDNICDGCNATIDNLDNDTPLDEI